MADKKENKAEDRLTYSSTEGLEVISKVEINEEDNSSDKGKDDVSGN